jgi:hypothetical protein
MVALTLSENPGPMHWLKGKPEVLVLREVLFSKLVS